ncbi:hypothetical protein HG536_0F04280 [Torulaspora globosa]|uniref:Uncharacterized protein n=1 Tax=Torulaspora globosa TaxID=48254 RepID=A0A7G3ZKR6_9SACH|nr:uncharacterized protein HG536_0F04280 [Torulaspora globosa]QLL34102.1 hypothetical protein HG536_0F04280 [Torulaspora globosa]
MNKVPQRVSSFGIGKLTSDILLSRAPVDSNGTGKHKAEKLILRSAGSQTLIDNWLKNAKVVNGPSKNGKAVTLHLPVVLKTLQRLRSTDNRASYFALISKIQSSRISWLDIANKPIDCNGALPVEFFNEVSSMLYRISLTCDAQELRLLSKFTLNLLHSCKKSMNHRASFDLKVRTKLFRNCLMPIARTESVALINEALDAIPTEQGNLKYLTELAFYYHSSQFTKVLSQLNKINLGKITLSPNEIDAFFPLFFGIIQSFVIYGDEQTCVWLITKLSKDWGYQMDPHYRGMLAELCEKYAAYQVLGTLAVSSPLLQWKALQSQLTWEEFMKHLRHLNIDLFKESQDLDFLQEKLATVGPNLKAWELFLRDKIPDDANPSLKSFAVNTILMHLAANKRLPFVLSILEHLINEVGYAQQLLDSGKLLSTSKYSGFHCLFKACSVRNPAIFSSYTLFKFLEQNQQIPFKFTSLDFYYMMQACLAGADHHSLYFFLFQFIRMMGPSFYADNQGKSSWALPVSIEQLLRHKVAKERGDDKVMQIVNEVRNWFLEHRSNAFDTTIDLAFLREAFGDKYLPSLTVGSMIALEQKHIDKYMSSGDEQYCPAADLHASRRLKRMLASLMENINVKQF